MAEVDKRGHGLTAEEIEQAALSAARCDDVSEDGDLVLRQLFNIRYFDRLRAVMLADDARGADDASLKASQDLKSIICKHLGFIMGSLKGLSSCCRTDIFFPALSHVFSNTNFVDMSGLQSFVGMMEECGSLASFGSRIEILDLSDTGIPSTNLVLMLELLPNLKVLNLKNAKRLAKSHQPRGGDVHATSLSAVAAVIQAGRIPLSHVDLRIPGMSFDEVREMIGPIANQLTALLLTPEALCALQAAATASDADVRISKKSPLKKSLQRQFDADILQAASRTSPQEYQEFIDHHIKTDPGSTVALQYLEQLTQVTRARSLKDKAFAARGLKRGDVVHDIVSPMKASIKWKSMFQTSAATSPTTTPYTYSSPDTTRTASVSAESDGSTIISPQNVNLSGDWSGTCPLSGSKRSRKIFASANMPRLRMDSWEGQNDDAGNDASSSMRRPSNVEELTPIFVHLRATRPLSGLLYVEEESDAEDETSFGTWTTMPQHLVPAIPASAPKGDELRSPTRELVSVIRTVTPENNAAAGMDFTDRRKLREALSTLEAAASDAQRKDETFPDMLHRQYVGLRAGLVQLQQHVEKEADEVACKYNELLRKCRLARSQLICLGRLSK